MPSLLGNKVVSEELQEENNKKNNYFLVFGVLLFIFVYSYFFTQVYRYTNLPSPESLLKGLGIGRFFLFDDDTNLDSTVEMDYSNNIYYSNDGERLVFFGLFAIIFLATYFSPVKYKRAFIVAGTFSIFFLLFNWQHILLFLSMHLLVYLAFHYKNKYTNIISFLTGIFIFYALLPVESISIIEKSISILDLLKSLLSGFTSYILYRFLIVELLEMPKIASIIRNVLIQSTMLSIVISLIVNSINGFVWSIPIGIFLFFVQWQRLILYHLDYKDKLIPEDLNVVNYLSTFLNPSIAPNIVYGHVIGSGYKYINSNFMVEDKNKLVLDGLKIWSIALLYLLTWNFIPNAIKSFCKDTLNIDVFIEISSLIDAHIEGKVLSTPSVLISTLLYQVKWFVFFGAVVHFKVGIWRLLGFRLAPYFDKPWLATNLISLWARYSFYFREFLVKTFYYPVFLNYFKKHKTLRIFMATFAASCVGNYTWGHIPEVIMLKGLDIQNLVYILPRWPYYLLLGTGISLTQVYLLRKRSKRKPWTRDWKIILDVIAMYLTIQFFSLIHIFARPTPNGTLWDYTTLFLLAFGIRL